MWIQRKDKQPNIMSMGWSMGYYARIFYCWWCHWHGWITKTRTTTKYLSIKIRVEDSKTLASHPCLILLGLLCNGTKCWLHTSEPYNHYENKIHRITFLWGDVANQYLWKGEGIKILEGEGVWTGQADYLLDLWGGGKVKKNYRWA